MPKLMSVDTSSPVSAPEVLREITLLEEEPSLGAPKFVLTVAYVKREDWKGILRPLMKKGEVNANPTLEEEGRFRSSVVNKSWRDWTGATLTNLCRLSDTYYNRKDQMKEQGFSDEEELEYDQDNALALATQMNSDHFSEVVNNIGNLEEFVVAQSKREKKDETSS